MSVLSLRLREGPPERLDLSPITPNRLAGLSAAEIERIPVGTTRRRLVVGDIFDVGGDDVDDIRIVGGSERLDLVGHGMTAGCTVVDGDVGQRLGFAMTGGDIRVAGSAGPFAASGATGGVIRIAGDAGASAGGAVHGAMQGLDGATLVIAGRAGPRLGDRMRRGLIVAGGAGDFAACRMIAGTIVAQSLGNHAGYGMRRGTVLTKSYGRLPQTFLDTGRHRFVFLQVLRPMLSKFDLGWADILAGDVRRFAGDMAVLGKGEILVPVL